VRVDPYNTIQEANENNNQAHKPITIEPTYDQLPIASFTYSRLNPAANETIMFNATNSYDPDGFIVNYEWDFGDDIAAAGEIVEHSYSKPGDYIVILRVTDNASVSNTNTMILTITMVETAVCGDVTGDINVTMADARRIVMWLSYPEDYPIHNPWAADVTGDGTVTMADARRIVMWLSYPYQYPLTCSLP
jgi:PKD repeat protein